jgi:hypothetical protein
MPYLETLIYIVLAHALGDYFLQTSYIANGKGKDDYLLFIHCVLYVVPFVIFFGITWHLIPLFVIHVIADRLKARHNKINLLADQIIHYAVALLYLI